MFQRGFRNPITLLILRLTSVPTEVSWNPICDGTNTYHHHGFCDINMTCWCKKYLHLNIILCNSRIFQEIACFGCWLLLDTPVPFHYVVSIYFQIGTNCLTIKINACNTECCVGPNVSTTSQMWPGPRLNIKTVLSTYGDFHVKDKTAVRTSYL